MLGAQQIWRKLFCRRQAEQSSASFTLRSGAVLGKYLNFGLEAIAKQIGVLGGSSTTTRLTKHRL
jgi:hypothetical protein